MAQQADDQKNQNGGKAEGYDKQTYVQLSTANGLHVNVTNMPQLGLGTWLSKTGEVKAAVSYALDIGYRHIDCAFCYGNEKEVGEAFNDKLLNPKTKVLNRNDVFVTSKLWNTKHHPDDVIPSIRGTLADLQLEYLDLYLIHFPMSFKRGDNKFPKKEDGSVDYGVIVDIVDTWRAMEECVRLGLAKHIGVSNFNKKQIESILAMCTIRPACNQCESHPYLTQNKLIDFCKSKKIAFTAYSPLGNPNRPWAKPTDPTLLKDPKLLEIAKNKNCTVAQLLIRYQIERGVMVIPKSVKNERIKQNFEVWNMAWSEKDSETVESFNRDYRGGVPLIQLEDGTSAARDRFHPFFPFNDEY